MSKVFDLALHDRERFLSGDLATKKEMLADFGQNPILLNGELELTPHPWFVPIENDYKNIETVFDKVRTLPQQIQEEAFSSVRSSWLEIMYADRTFFDHVPDEAINTQIREILISYNIEIQ